MFLSFAQTYSTVSFFTENKSVSPFQWNTSPYLVSSSLYSSYPPVLSELIYWYTLHSLCFKPSVPLLFLKMFTPCAGMLISQIFSWLPSSLFSYLYLNVIISVTPFLAIISEDVMPRHFPPSFPLLFFFFCTYWHQNIMFLWFTLFTSVSTYSEVSPWERLLAVVSPVLINVLDIS